MKQVDAGVGEQGGRSSVPQPQGRLGLPRTLSKSHSSRLDLRGMESVGWLWTLSSGMSEETDIPGASQALKQLHSDMGASLRRFGVPLMCLVPFRYRHHSSQGSSNQFLLSQKLCVPVPGAFLTQDQPP